MTRIPVLAVLCLIAGCGLPQLPSVDALAADPELLRTLRTRCERADYDGAVCERVARADLQRLLSGRSDPSEYRTLAQVPPLPETFDEPAWPCHE